MKSRGVAGSRESLPRVIWVLEIKPSLLEEHLLLLIAEPSPQLQAVVLFCFVFFADSYA